MQGCDYRTLWPQLDPDLLQKILLLLANLHSSLTKQGCVQDHVDDIRKMYKKDWDSTDVQRQQMGCALYFIDQLALRAGHEKDEDEADTVGCCTLKVRHPLLHPLQSQLLHS